MNKVLLYLFIYSAFFFTAIPLLHADDNARGKLPVNTLNAETPDSSDFSFYAETGFDFLSNIYGLSDSQKSVYNANEPGDVTSGRFDGMESLSDFIFIPQVGIRYRGTFRISSWLKYNVYSRNGKCSYPEGKVKLEQSVSKKDNVFFECGFIYGFYKKNYLSGAADSDSNNNISRDERIYAGAIYDEYEARAGYEHVFIKKKGKRRLSHLGIEPFAGYRYRLFNGTFGNRNLKGLNAGLSLKLGFRKWIDFKTTYCLERTFCPDNEELVLYDEVSSGMDVDSSGSYTSNAPLVTNIDRSAWVHGFRMEPSFFINRDWSLSLGYKTEITVFTTGHSLDVKHNNRTEYYHIVKAGTRYNFTENLRGELNLSRKVGEDSDDGRYSEISVSTALRYNFF